MSPEEYAEAELGELIASLPTLLLGSDDLQTFLDSVATMASTVVEPPAACGITTQTEHGPATVATSDPRAGEVDERQYDAGVGPCLQALATGEPVEVEDQATDERWPAYREQALRLGLRCSLSLPLQFDGRTLGALNIYGFDRPQSFGGSERRRVERFAEQATTAIALAVQRNEQQHLAQQMEEALASRSVIDQALGVLMAQERCTAGAAFDLLRRHSQNTNRKLRDVAVDVITRLTGHPPSDPTPFRTAGEGIDQQRA